MAMPSTRSLAARKKQQSQDKESGGNGRDNWPLGVAPDDSKVVSFAFILL